MVKEVIMTGCRHCGDFFVVTPQVMGVPNAEEYAILNDMEQTRMITRMLRWWTIDKQCWNCGEVYNPQERKMLIDDFVFEAFKGVKGG